MPCSYTALQHLQSHPEVLPAVFDTQRQAAAWQMLDVSALADLGVEWREASNWSVLRMLVLCALYSGAKLVDRRTLLPCWRGR